jgi:hypothetical protein
MIIQWIPQKYFVIWIGMMGLLTRSEIPANMNTPSARW